MEKVDKWEIAIIENHVTVAVKTFWLLPAAPGAWLFQLEDGRFLFFEKKAVHQLGYYIEADFEKGYVVPNYLIHYYILPSKEVIGEKQNLG